MADVADDVENLETMAVFLSAVPDAAQDVEHRPGLRELLIAECERTLAQWRIPGRVYEHEEALKSGAAVTVRISGS
ncbi:MAG: hypothetical protein QOE52_3749 [Mycobacterium sp.]|jgi:hypothetical protein|nr:hypothetical protein [Mycobacterium sp.]